jgi:hypothetical protein
MRPESVLRWTARAWGIASALLLCAFGGREHLRFTPAEAVVFLLFPGGVVAGFAVAWWGELAGGLVTVGSLALFYLVLFARNGRVPATPYFLLFAAPGFLHVVGALIAARRRRGGAAANPAGGPDIQAAQPSRFGRR